MTIIKLPHIYRARDYQKDFWDALHGEGKHKGKKYWLFVLIWHRRGGKDLTSWNAAIEHGAENVETIKYGFPTGDMARDNLWESVTNNGLAFTDFIPMALRERKHRRDNGLNDSLKRVNFINGTSLRVMSFFKPGRARGGNSKLFVLSEIQMHDPRIIDIIEPIVEANGGIVIVNGTANGDSWLKYMLESWKNDPNVYVSILTVNDTNVFTPEQMVKIRQRTIERFLARGQSEEEANAFVDQEYYCSFEAPVSGAYFGGGMRRAENENRIRDVPYDPLLRVNTYWDLGIDDSMSIWFVQLYANEIRVIDYYENSGEGLPFYFAELDKRGYVYGEHYAPHDIEVRELSSGMSRKETAMKLGINFKTVPKPNKKEEAINAIRTILPRCYFDKTKCDRGIKALKSYHKTWNEKMMRYENEPVHDWSSHATDAFSTLALTDPRALTNRAPIRRPQKRLNMMTRR
jgi:hypothetical protein